MTGVEQSDRWMTVSEIREYSGRGHNTIREALRIGQLAGVQPGVGCSWRALRSEVDAWMNRGAPATNRRRFRAA